MKEQKIQIPTVKRVTMTQRMRRIMIFVTLKMFLRTMILTLIKKKMMMMTDYDIVVYVYQSKFTYLYFKYPLLPQWS